ncbi:MATH and LRR domain-containing protein PFE0570w-like [Vespula maculifrons]|uniref:MATH and LRR domain-containing protein PFE0570w-like n=1 Tax=Vespula maculifrons TaxID=7453 RepID=A0ABD2CMU2_VESMC
MRRQWKFELSLLTCLAIFVTGEPSLNDITLQVNTRKLVSVSSDKFLSLAIDPLAILTSDDVLVNYERSIRMARALSPAYLRLGGPQSNSYLVDERNDTNYVFSERNWRRLHQWAGKTGLDVVACISPRFMSNDSELDLVSLTDRMGFNASWQLGYECQTRCNFSGADVGRYVRILRNKLNAIPRYSNSIITGPDVVAYETKEQREYIENFFSEADVFLTAVTWHPDLGGVTWNDDEGVFMDRDQFLSDNNNLYKIIERDAANKPLWIAESKYEKSKNQFLGALAWANRLGNIAKLGIQVLMRQPADLSKPTPDYWVSVLHKKLVGREVLDTRIQVGNKSHVHFYVQCTKASAIYEKGALTIFGINLTPMKIRANLKDLKIKSLHEYVLTPGFDAENRMFSESVLLNGKPLSFFNETELPEFEPVISNDEKGLSMELPSGGIGFWVVPNQKMRFCMDHEVQEENLVERTLKKELQKSQIKRNEIPRKRRLIDRQKTIACQENKKRRSLVKREIDGRERKLKKIDMQKQIEKYGKVLKRKLALNEIKKSTSESVDLSDPYSSWKANETVKNLKRSKRDLDKFLSDFHKSDQKYIPENNARRNEQPRILSGSKKEKSNENNFYGFFRKEPMKNFPNGDVFLKTDDSTEKKKDYDYTKDEDEKREKVEEKVWKARAMNIRTINHIKLDNTGIDVDDDYRGYIPNEFFETVNMPNVRIKENSNDYANVLNTENIKKHSINKENDEKDNIKTETIADDASDLAEVRRIKENNVNMLMNYYSDSSAGKSNQQNLEESSRVKIQGSKLGDSIVASLGKTELTLPDRRRTKTVPIQKNEMTDLDVLHYSNSIGLPMHIPTYSDLKQDKRLKRKVNDLNMILEKEMIDENDENLKNCRSRVIRNLNDDLGLIRCKTKRQVNENYEETMESDSGNVRIYETEHYEEPTESDNEDNYKTEHYEETIESDNENIDNYKTEHYEETTESNNENVDNYITEHYEEPIESDNENLENYKTEYYEKSIESDNENIEDYENGQSKEIEQQLVESIKRDFDQKDNREIEDSSAIMTELRNHLSGTSQDVSEINDSMVNDYELGTEEDKFFRGPSGQTKEKKTTIDFKKDSYSVTPRPSQYIPSISKETKTTETWYDTRTRRTSSSREAEETETETETEKSEDLTNSTVSGELSSQNITKQIRTDQIRRKPTKELSKTWRKLVPKTVDSSKTKIKSNSRKYEATEAPEASEAPTNETLIVFKKENEKRKRNIPKLISREKDKQGDQHNYRKRRKTLRHKLHAREEDISQLYNDKISNVIKRNIDECKTKEKRENLKREIQENLRNNEDYDGMVDLKKIAYFSTYEPIDYDTVKKEKQVHREKDRKYIPLIGIVGPLKKIQDKLIESKSYLEDPRVILHTKYDGAKSRLIQSLGFPYNIIDERKRYDKDQLAFGKRYYVLVDSTKEKDPWMFRYQRKLEEKLRNAYESNGREKLPENSKVRTLELPITYIYDKSEETIDSEETLKSRAYKYQIDTIDSTIYDPELQTHEYSSESLIYDDDSMANVYNLILKPKLYRGSKNNQNQKSTPILYLLQNTKRLNDVQKQSDVESYVLERRKGNDHSEEESETVNNSTYSERDEDESITINPSSIENSEKIEENSKIDENQENVENHRTRRDVEEMNSILIKKLPLSPCERNKKTRSKRYDYLNLNNDLSIDSSIENPKRFSKLLKKPNLFESIFDNPTKKSLLSFDTRFTKNHRTNKDLSKSVIPFSKDKDLMESLEDILFDDDDISEKEEYLTSEKHSIDLDKETLNNEINRENEDFNAYRDTLKMLPSMIQKNKLEHRQLQDTQRINSNSNNDEISTSRYNNNMLQNKNEMFKNPKLNLKQIYSYINENNNEQLEDINHEDLNKESEKLDQLWEFNPLLISEEENYVVDNFLEPFLRHNSLMKNNDQKNEPNGSNKSSFFLQETIPKLQKVITEKFDTAQNVTESLEEFTESFDKKFNKTLLKDDRNKTATSSTNTNFSNDDRPTSIYQMIVTNAKKLFTFLSDFVHMLYRK